MREISTDEFFDLLEKGETIREVRVSEALNFDRVTLPGSDYYKRIEIVDCSLFSLDAIQIQFHELVSLKNTRIESFNGSFTFSYFLGGLAVTGCTFETQVEFQSGVHNQRDCPFILRDNHFKGFVNFFDCWFDGPVEITNCIFDRGTNLLGNKGNAGRVEFKVPPLIENNFGQLDVNGEGE